MGRGRSESVETPRGSHRCFASIFHSWILRRFLRVSPSSSGAWARGVRGPPCRCLQARRPHAHVACPAVPVAARPVPGARGRRHRSGAWASAGLLHAHAGRPPRFPARRCALGACRVARGMRRGHGAGTGSSCAATDWAETPAARPRAGQTSRADEQGPACERARSGRGPLGRSHVAVGAWPDPKDSGTF